MEDMRLPKQTAGLYPSTLHQESSKVMRGVKVLWRIGLLTREVDQFLY